MDIVIRDDSFWLLFMVIDLLNRFIKFGVTVIVRGVSVVRCWIALILSLVRINFSRRERNVSL